ncbi:hypothetical protein, partial [Methylococcus sp. S1B]|uniref:hypothetical protein n=1 Tax=Methylococcus sp. S1B TaxID=3435347 RepID=UPI003D7ECBC7
TRLTDDASGAPASPKRTVAGASVEPLQASDQSVKFIIPAEFEDGVYAARITTANASTIDLLNAPTVYWAQGDQGVHA